VGSSLVGKEILSMVQSNVMREKRSPIAKRAAALGLGLILIFSAAPVLADDSAEGPSTLDRTFDAIVLRPLGAVTLLMGAGLFIPAALLGAPGGSESIDNGYDVFILTPWENLVDAPLGRGYGL
jgi:hypothetical protein